MSVVSAELSYQIFVRSVAVISGILSLIGAFVRDPNAIAEGRKPVSLFSRIIAFVTGMLLLLVAFGVLK
jgi:hypothetical protein